jgi:hypothetical protein
MKSRERTRGRKREGKEKKEFGEEKGRGGKGK